MHFILNPFCSIHFWFKKYISLGVEWIIFWFHAHLAIFAIWKQPLLNVNANLHTNMHRFDCLLPKVEPRTGFHKIGWDFTSLQNFVSFHIQIHESGPVCMPFKQYVNYRDLNCTSIRNINEFHQFQLTFTSLNEKRTMPPALKYLKMRMFFLC